MEDREDEIQINVDPFSDSYARNTNLDELTEILKHMAENEKHTVGPLDARTFHKIEGLIQDKIDSGYTAPCGWLFHHLTFFFYQDGETSDTEQGELTDISLQLARTTALFGGVGVASSIQSPEVTHIIANPDILSSDERVSLRKALAERPGKKLPNLVSVAWLEESWANGTLLDEE
ncbi:Nucleic acid-binding OB-fold, partial [Penicillium herquei]